ncbi:MAG TPA: glutamine synthetase III [Erysipelotrichaceae bacterium]|nr:glutamine synthetase III [Erysipelotrichaceae bacterium]
MSHPFDDFGIHLFGEKLMRERLPYPVYTSWKTALAKESALDRGTADAIAHAMKTWAMELGATHFTHWFQPLTGQTAEKHDSFLEVAKDGSALAQFSGKGLIKGETDGSSFPSGGLRATFEARGYTYWDISSPAFIRDNVLCIPSIFVSYNGEPLDQKAPLLKALDRLSFEASRVVQTLGDKQVKHVNLSVGLEQEYFLVDKSMYEERKDLLLTGRTLLGASAPRGQEFEDHYFGSIPARVKAYMDEVNTELWKVGVFSKVEHNEVAPGQFEFSVIFAEANIAVDQNQILMDLLKKIAIKHDLACLLHEKPFKGINGSGKHNNWSLITDDGQNLLEPGDKPHENIRFLLFVSAIIKAIDEFPELIRLAASGPGNDHRLGANEAPPAIISVFMGDVVEHILLNLADKKVLKTNKEGAKFSALNNLSYMPKDNTDRNRTSPFAFTGNKFELRMLGSSLSASFANTVISTIVADALKEIADRLDDFKYLQDVRDEALKIIQEIMRKHHRVLFSGDGYSDAWVKEAEERGLPNIKSFVEAVEFLDNDKATKLFERNAVFTTNELAARSEILYEQYIKTIQVEAKTLIRMVEREVVPQATIYLSSILGLKGYAFYDKQINTILGLVDSIDAKLTKLKLNLDKTHHIESLKEEGLALRHDVFPLLDEIREDVDKLELVLPRNMYPFPSYLDLLFLLD